jgi:DNA-binding NtrC family response regulator
VWGASEVLADLVSRLGVFPVRLPRLRERSGDIRALAEHFLRKYARRNPRAATALSAEAVAKLEAYAWPGNVRELANVLERAVILAEDPVLRAAELRPLLRPLAAAGERDRLRQALVEAAGDKRRATELLRMSYRTLLRKIKEHDLEGVPQYRD